MTRHQRASAIQINIIVDKTVDEFVDDSQKLSIIDGFELFAWILGSIIYQ